MWAKLIGGFWAFALKHWFGLGWVALCLLSLSFLLFLACYWQQLP